MSRKRKKVALFVLCTLFWMLSPLIIYSMMALHLEIITPLIDSTSSGYEAIWFPYYTFGVIFISFLTGLGAASVVIPFLIAADNDGLNQFLEKEKKKARKI